MIVHITASLGLYLYIIYGKGIIKMNKLSRTLIILSMLPFIMSSCNTEKNDSSTDIKNTVYEEISDMTASELVSRMTIGWNLGNTLESTLGKNNLPSREYETGWGNPLTTKENIQGIRDSGFNVLRIPVSWGEHVSSDGNYTIDEEWLNRVNEVVDYGIELDMFVILNTHHEEWFFPDEEHFEQNKDQLVKIWTQIGNRFEGYSEKLIFEGLNEPRKRGTPVEWNGGDEEGRDIVNRMNAIFVETIRGLGGNNPKRHLMIPTYGASNTSNAIYDLKIPENDDKIIVSVHAYTPYNFALASKESGISEWSEDDTQSTSDIDNFLLMLKDAFLDKNIPVIIGEMGAVNRDNITDRAEWSEYYIRKTKEYGIPCLWWDNGAFMGGGELFGLYSRNSDRWIFRDVVEGLMKGLE